MGERPPEYGGVGREYDFPRFEDLPYHYQCLGKACAEAGVLSEFYEVLERGFDYGQALARLRHDLEQAEKVEDLDAFLERFDLLTQYDDEFDS